MKPPLEIHVTAQAIERMRADLAVVGLLANETPLRGGAGRIDWRLCGFLSNLMVAGRFDPQVGEAALLPTYGHLRVDRVLVLGLGDWQQARAAERVEASCRDALERCLGLGARRVAFAHPALSPDLVAKNATALLRGLMAVARDDEPFELRLPMARDAVPRATVALERGLEELGCSDITVSRPTQSHSPGQRPHGGPPVL